jgi:putative transposase
MSRQPYPTDLSAAEWALLEPLIPPAKSGGRPRDQDMREIVNAIFYQLASGGSWRMLPHDLPHWETVYGYWRDWQRAGLWEQWNTLLRRQVRARAGREPEPSAAILDSQSVKTSARGGVRGYDAGKKVKGRKRHIAVDTLGLLLGVLVLTADVQDRDGAKPLLRQLKADQPRLQLLWADGGYAGQLVSWVAAHCGWVLEIVKRSDVAQGFVLLAHRWVVERTFAWLTRYRRLNQDYEALPAVSEAWVYAAMVHLMLRRLGGRRSAQRRQRVARHAGERIS